jgi:DNA-binding transcriptional LysR family regulator
MRVDWLKAFRAVMQTGTVTGAAAIMLRTQPQVSRMIANLEAALDLRLFEREGRRLLPTEAGLQFLQYAEPLLLGLDGARGAAQDIKHRRGRPLIISAEPFLLHALVPEAIQSLSRHQDIKCAADICMRGLGLWMSRGAADLGVVALPFAQTDMERIVFAEAELVAVLPPGHPLAQKQLIQLTDLTGEKFIALRPSTLLRAQIDIAAAGAGINLDTVLETTSGVTACDFVARGLGVTIADPIVAASFLPVGVTVRRLTLGLRLSYGYLLPKGTEGSEQISPVVAALADAALRLGGEFVRLTAG